jgi:hypothetical protein
VAIDDDDAVAGDDAGPRACPKRGRSRSISARSTRSFANPAIAVRWSYK